MNFTWMIGGEAGFGIMTTGTVFAKIASRSGYNIFDYIEYPSLIRGGHNAYEVHVSDQDVAHLAPTIDVLVCLNRETFEKHKNRLTPRSYVVYDNGDFQPQGDFKKIGVPVKKTLSDLKGEAVMKNTIALGASLAVVGGDIVELENLISQQFSRKGESVIEFNKKFARTGFEFVKNNYQELQNFLVKKSGQEEKLIMTGNEAFSLGAVISDCRFYCAYPMTPSSSVLTTLAAWQKDTGMIVRHAEDEISVINTAVGASFSGARSAVGTSGGGFALMVETISLSGVTETPLLIFLAQRPGPATGMPTWTEQGDLLFAVHSGHGEFPKIILAPGTVEEMVELTTKAFNLADVYQLPVIVISDMYLSEGHKSIRKKFVDDLAAAYKVNRGKLVTTAAAPAGGKSAIYERYRDVEDGVSPRLLPGTPGYYYQANSYEHLEDGHTTEDAAPRIIQVKKRARKWQTYFAKDFSAPEVLGDLKSSEIVFVSWGSNKGTIIEGQRQLSATGKKTAFIHFTHVYPLDKTKIAPIFADAKRYILVENNSTGQFGKLLLQETGINIEEKILRYDGRPITVENIIEHVNSSTR